MYKITDKKQLSKKLWVIIAAISFSISVLLGLLILNWFFEITTVQKLQGAPILFTIFINPIGLILGVLSFRKTQSKIAKWSIISNSILLILPLSYFFFGILIFGL